MKADQTISNRRGALTAFTVAVISMIVLGFAKNASAQTHYYWVSRDWTSGASYGAYWSYNNNWSTSSGGAGLGGSLLSAQNILVFDGGAVAPANGLYNNTNNSYGSAFQIYFNSAIPAAYNLYGNQLTFYDYNSADPNIQNESTTYTPTINMPIANGNNNGTYHILNINSNSSGALTFNGTVSSADTGQTLRVININGSGTITFNGIISDKDSTHQLAISQLGSGTTIFAAANTYSGATTVSGGKLQVGNGGTSGQLGVNGSTYSAVGMGSSGATVSFKRTDSITVSNTISGSANFIISQDGTGSTMLAGSTDNAYAQGTVNAGMLVLGKSSSSTNHALGGTNETVNSGGTLQLSGSGGDQIQDGASVTVNSGGVFDLNGQSETISSISLAGTGISGSALTNSGSSSSTLTLNNASTLASAATIGCAGNITLNGNGVLKNGSTGTTVTKTGAGTLTIANGNGVDNLNFLLTVSAGTAVLNTSSSSSAHAVGGLTVNSGGTAQLSGSGGYEIYQGATPTVNSGGVLDLNGQNQTFTSAGPTISGTGISSGGALINSSNTASTLTSALILGASSSVGGAGSLTIASNISGAFALTKVGAGTLTLSGANTYTGGTTLSTGQLNINNAGSGGTSSAIGTGALTISGGTIDDTSGGDITLSPNNAQSWNGDFTYAGSANNLNLGTGAITLGANRTVTVSGNNLTVGGAIGGAFSLTKAGSGTLTLNGANTYSGGTTIKAGQITISGSSSGTSGPLGPNTANVFLGDTSGSAAATLAFSSTAETHNYPLTVQFGSSGTKKLFDAGNNPFAWSGTVTLNDSLTLDSGSGSGSINLSGPITGTGGVTVNVSSGGTGYVQLSTTSSGDTYSGNTTITQGTNRLGSATAIPSGSGKGIVTLNPASGTAAFDLHGNNQTINGLTSSGTGSAVVDNVSSNTAVTLTVGTSGSNPNGTFAGVIQNSSIATLGLTKAGSGTLTLSGANTYSGSTTVSAGTLALSGSGSIASSPQISIATGATFDVSAITAGGYSLNSSGTLALNINKTGSTLTQGQLVLGSKNLVYAGSLTVTASGSALTNGDSFILVTNTGTESGWFSSVTVPALASGISWDTNKLATTGVLDIYTFTTTALALSTPTNTAATISAAKLANHASSARGTPVATSATTPSHGTASVTSGVLTYTPTSGYSGGDSFTVTFQDGHGWQTMTVSVTVGNGNLQSPNYLSSGTTNIVGVNYFYVNFAGIPGDTYTVETNSVASGSGWTKWGNITASSTGAMQVLDPVSNASLFYRTVYPAY